MLALLVAAALARAVSVAATGMPTETSAGVEPQGDFLVPLPFD